MVQGYGQSFGAAPGGRGGPGFVPGQGLGFGRGQGFGHGQRFVDGPMGRGHFLPLGGIFMAIIGLAILALLVFAFWQMFEKAGHPGALGLLMLVPLVNLGAVLYLAFSEWPVLTELQRLREKVGPAEPVAVTAPPPAPPAAPPAAADTTTSIPPASPDA